MAEQVRVGIIGTSWWADLMYLPNLRSHPQARVEAICGRNRDRAEEMAAKYGVAKVFTDYREMIERGGLDAVVVSTPDDLHHPMTLVALDAGLHVLCEKPLAMNAVEAREMYERAEERGVKHMVLFTFRWRPYFSYVRDLIQKGYLGRPYQAQLRFVGGYARSDAYAWRFDRKRANGALGDLGSHMIDMARWCLGDIAGVGAKLGTFVQRQGPDGRPLEPANDGASLLLEFAGGAQGVIQVSAVPYLADRDANQSLIVYGEEGTLEVNVDSGGPGEGAVVRGARRDEESFGTLPVPDEFLGDFKAHSLGPRAFIDAILDDRPATPTFYDGLKAQEVIDAAIASHRSGRWVAL